MKKADLLIKLLLMGVLLMGVLTVLDYLPLHDIRQDYVSPGVIEEYAAAGSENLPAWTDAGLEWGFVTVNFVLKVLVSAVNILLALILIKNWRGNAGMGFQS